MHSAIRTENLYRSYRSTARKDKEAGRDFVALDQVNLEVQPGELFGLLGSNGAGKTTLIKILATLLAPTSGRAFVDGLDVVTDFEAIRPRINMVSGGETSGYGVLTVRETLWLFSQLYGIPNKEARSRIDSLLAVTGLADKADTRISHLSTGLRQKMNICRGFVTDPKILFLDEPTLGLDVTAARLVRQFIREWLGERPERTIVLTTHYLAEAEELCDRIAIIHHGRVLACDTPAALKRGLQRHTIFELSVAKTNGANGHSELGQIAGIHSCELRENADLVEVRVALEEEMTVGRVVQAVLDGGSQILSLKKVEPSLEDVFVALVGHGVTSSGPEEVGI
jgi:ABC-2 type transport system ATP-binding protein